MLPGTPIVTRVFLTALTALTAPTAPTTLAAITTLTAITALIAACLKPHGPGLMKEAYPAFVQQIFALRRAKLCAQSDGPLP